MREFAVHQIGCISSKNGEFGIKLEPDYRIALTGIDDFGYVNILWWFSGCDDYSSRNKLTEQKPYRCGPDILGTFATRSPLRPNPIALSCSGITYVDVENGVIGLSYIDAYDGSPVLDIKPYVPSLDKVSDIIVPKWCSHWPENVEDSGEFDWEREFNF